jgi:hypothetical protein
MSFPAFFFSSVFYFFGVSTFFQANLGHVLKHLRMLKDAWPFLEPVDAKQVTDYYNVIRFPMGMD